MFALYWLRQSRYLIIKGLLWQKKFPKSMKLLLSQNEGFVFQSSEIYGGLNGFFDYGPLGVELRKNIKDAWWQDMVEGGMIWLV